MLIDITTQRNHSIDTGESFTVPDGCYFTVSPQAGATYSLTGNGVSLPNISVPFTSPGEQRVRSTGNNTVVVESVSGTIYIVTYT